jgi:6-phosphogluconolactonase (cycloisomerase 2 family)
MVDRRTFTTLLAGAIAAPTLAFGKLMAFKNVFYSAVGPELTAYGVDVDNATLFKQGTVTVPANIQYAWRHPKKHYLYVVSSSGGPAAGGTTGSVHAANAFAIDRANGTLKPHGQTIKLNSRPIHASVDQSGRYLLIAYNNPSNLTVHRINADGTIGDQVEQPNKLDTGIFAHQIRVTPDNQHVILVTRGNNAPSDKQVDPGSIKTFGFKDGVLTNLAAIAPGDGMHFGPRHLDFHPKKPWVFVSIESQNQLAAYKLDGTTGLSREPMFAMKNTLSDPNSKLRQAAGPIHVGPNGRFVYLTNRAGVTATANQERFEGRPVFTSNESSIAVYAIDQQTGEPTLIETAYAEGAHTRTFSFDASGRMLVAGSLVPIAVRQGDKVNIVPAALSVFRVGDNGKLTFVRKYDVDTGTNLTQWWTGMVQMA